MRDVRSDRRPILLTNARIIDPSRDLDLEGDLLIADGVIRDAKRGIGAAGVPEGTEVIDCRGKVAAPGLIDMRAFVGEPGAEYRETFASASQAAPAGGVTTIVSQPDTSPAIDEPAIAHFVLPKAAETVVLGRALRSVALAQGRYTAESIPCADSVEVLRQAKDKGLMVTAAASINHLTLNEIDVGSYRTFCKLAPPLRAEADRMALVEALASGLVDAVMSDHDPQDVETKRLPFAAAAPSAIAIEAMLAASLRLIPSC